MLVPDIPDGTALCASVKVFPGIVLGANLSGAKRISDKMLHSAAVAIASTEVSMEGSWFPSSNQIHETTARVAAAVLVQGQLLHVSYLRSPAL